ncbi:MAG: type II toxin-antitoxin system VapC family toxin [Candidatus Hydrothermarchaeales archaeon]
MFIFDTTAIIELFKGNEALKELLQRLNDDFAATTVSYFEIFSKIHHKKLKKEKVYFKRFFSNIPLYGLGIKEAEEGSQILGRLYQHGMPINLADVMISGIAAANGAEGIITLDTDFNTIEKVVDIKIEFF